MTCKSNLIGQRTDTPDDETANTKDLSERNMYIYQFSLQMES